MGFKLPGKSITNGTNAHRSALKMKVSPTKNLQPGVETGGLPHNKKSEIAAGKVDKDHEKSKHATPNKQLIPKQFLPSSQTTGATAKPWGDQYKRAEFKKMLLKDDKGVINKAIDKYKHAKSPKAGSELSGTKHAKKSKVLTKTLKKGAKKKIVKKVAGKVLSRAIPGAGWGLAAYDAGKFAKDWYKTGSAKKAWKKMWK